MGISLQPLAITQTIRRPRAAGDGAGLQNFVGTWPGGLRRHHGNSWWTRPACLLGLAVAAGVRCWLDGVPVPAGGVEPVAWRGADNRSLTVAARIGAATQGRFLPRIPDCAMLNLLMDIITGNVGWMRSDLRAHVLGPRAKAAQTPAQAMIARKRAEVFKPSIDTRYSDDEIVSHATYACTPRWSGERRRRSPERSAGAPRHSEWAFDECPLTFGDASSMRAVIRRRLPPTWSACVGRRARRSRHPNNACRIDGFEHLDPFARDHGPAQASDQLFALAREHGAADHFDPSDVCR